MVDGATLGHTHTLPSVEYIADRRITSDLDCTNIKPSFTRTLNSTRWYYIHEKMKTLNRHNRNPNRTSSRKSESESRSISD